MAALTEMGYLRQPHTSAGRVPTEEGYRYFVTHVVYQADLPEPARDTISHQFYQARQDVEQWMPLAASILAHHSQGGLHRHCAACRTFALQARRTDLHPGTPGVDGAGA